MLQNRFLNRLFICLIIIKLSEQSLGQGYAKKNLSPQQRRPQIAAGPQPHRPSDELKLLLQDKAKDMRRYMNLNQDRCKDLYEYSCGHWLQFQNVSEAKEGDRISVIDQLQRQVNLQLQELLRGPRKATEYDDTVVKQFYRSCTEAAASSPEQREFIRKFVQFHDGLPYLKDSTWHEKRYKWIDVIGHLKHRYNLDILISLTIPKSSQGRVIPILEEPQRTILPANLCSSLASQLIEEKDEVFNAIQMEIRDNLRAWFELGEHDATRLAGDIQRFEFELCKYMRKREMLDIPNESGNFNRTNYNQIVQNKFHGVLQSANSNPQQLSALDSRYNIEFTRFIHVSLGKGHSTPREFYFRNEEYFENLNNITQKGLTPSFAYYTMYRALSEILIPMNQPRAERPFYCVRKVMQYFPDILGNLYQTKYRRDHVLADLKDIFKNVKEAFIESIDVNAQWLQDNFRKDIKLRSNSWRIKEPEYQSSSTSSELNLESSPNYYKALEIVMEYSAQQNLQQLSSYPMTIRQHLEDFVSTFSTTVETRLQFSWALLQPPIYSINYPKSLKYSTLGYMMAREMVKQYDQQGWQENLPPIVNPWYPDSVYEFNRNRECFRVQVSNYFHNSPNVFRNGTQLREIAADTSAVNIAFSAYLKWLQDQESNNTELPFETLPDMNYSNTQLFFIHYAQSQCAVQQMATIAATPDFFPLDRHTLERFTVNGPISNGFEYGREFNCAIGSAMNVDDKCLIF